MTNKQYTFQELLDIMILLRSEKGCPWDREQTHESLKKYLIEETYEVLEALDSGDKHKFADELGDLLLQIVFHAQIGKEEGSFDINDVVSLVCQKMIDRHTHVFGQAKAETSDEVLDNWDEIKKKEKGLQNHTQVLKDVSTYLPALMRSYKVQQKAAKVGFDWDDVSGALDKVREEINEVEQVYKTENMGKIEDEIGDLLFAVVNVSRFLKIQPELALSGTIEKFISRFEYIENNCSKFDKKMEQLTLKEMDILWEEAKTHNLLKKVKNYE
ncbi:nucleoside triphosphate pyrophosphohydrolase [Petroclostridium sp. X23]|uniref:nucleoside triphosphate pyrophosphohydrolase n=1 Tax=Petroclostridium sp. X23 TaxID=3045146 RepID=UPI0024ADE2EE|nr:nucleoside triphosphate pyrophosphohydrolase [Petroclostridium sp. X23]WHH57610.1 nucleoside triphosphate pyrophosphohydrolase [Petroclostridium sp. X23]